MPTGEKQSEDVPAPCQRYLWMGRALYASCHEARERCALGLCDSHFGDPDWHPCARAQSHTL